MFGFGDEDGKKTSLLSIVVGTETVEKGIENKSDETS